MKSFVFFGMRSIETNYRTIKKKLGFLTSFKSSTVLMQYVNNILLESLFLHAWCFLIESGSHLKLTPLSLATSHVVTRLRHHTLSLEQNERALTDSTLQVGIQMPSKGMPCESCCTEGTRQRHHYRFQHYPHPIRVQIHPQGLQEARQAGKNQSKFHSLKLNSHQNQHHRGYR